MLRREFLIGAGAVLASAQSPKGIQDIRLDGKVATRFYYGDTWDKPFLYPLATASGIVVSRGWPIEPREGETSDHPWHRGLFFGHGIINGHDFWREQGRQKTSCLVAKASPVVVERKSGTTVSASFAMRPPTGDPIGEVAQSYAVSEKDGLRVINARITVNANAGVPLQFGDTDDGGFAFRLSDAFREDKGALLRNSSGLTGTKAIWGKPAKWVDYSATVDGRKAGVAILDHPSNLRHPTTWHARGYSLCSANPWGTKSFDKSAATDGSYTIPAGKSLVLRYSVVIHEGAEPAAIDGWFTEFAKSK